MKKIHIAAGVVIIAAIGMLIMSSQDVTSYANFEVASNSQNRVTIVGELDKMYEVNYDPQNAPEEYSFHMVDGQGVTKKVIVNEPKPRDFEKTESITATGKMVDDTFIADEILLKCPSKYQEEELALRQ